MRVNLLRAHGSPGGHLYSYHACRCIVCRGQVAEKQRAFRNADPARAKATARRYRDRHPEMERVRHRLWREANPNRIAELARLWRETHRDARSADQRRYYAANRDRVKEYVSAWRFAHPEEIKSYASARFSRLRSSSGVHTGRDIRAQHARQRGRCFWCSKRVDKTYHVDHVTPLALGGSNGPENLVVACPSCNLKKHAAHPMDFAGVLL